MPKPPHILDYRRPRVVRRLGARWIVRITLMCVIALALAVAVFAHLNPPGGMVADVMYGWIEVYYGSIIVAILAAGALVLTFSKRRHQ